MYSLLTLHNNIKIFIESHLIKLGSLMKAAITKVIKPAFYKAALKAATTLTVVNASSTSVLQNISSITSYFPLFQLRKNFMSLIAYP